MISFAPRGAPRAAAAGFALAALVLTASACGGGKPKVPSGAVAIVKDTPITFTALQAAVQQRLVQAKAAKQPVPKPGSPNYVQVEYAAIQALVQQAEIVQGAKDLGVSVSDGDVAAAVINLEKSYFPGKKAGTIDQTKLKAALTKAGLSPAELDRQLRIKLLSQKVASKLTASVNVTSSDVLSYYNAHKRTTYVTPKSRHMRQIVVKTKAAADAIYATLRTSAAMFGAIAKKQSTDTVYGPKGGDMGDVGAGANGAAFDSLAFNLAPNIVARPFKDELGQYRVVEALGPVKPSKIKPLDASIKAQIKGLIETQRKNKVIYEWYTGLQHDFQGKINYQTGYAPPVPQTTT